MPKCGIYYSILLETPYMKNHQWISTLLRLAENTEFISANITENILAYADITHHNCRI